MQLGQQHLNEFGKLVKANNTMIIPADLANIADVLKVATTLIKEVK